MNVLYREYQESLFAFIQSGIDVIYLSKKINGVEISFPYISDEQNLAYQCTRLIMTTKQAEIQECCKNMEDQIEINNKRFRDWDWFCLCFNLNIEHLEEDSFVYVYGHQAIIVPLRITVGLCNLQRDLWKELFRCSIESSQYYPFRWNNCGLGFTNDEIFNLETIQPTLLSSPRVKTESLFIDYLLYQAVDYSEKRLNEILSEIYNNYHGEAKTKIKEWILHTEILLNCNENAFETNEQKDVIKIVRRFCQKQQNHVDYTNTLPYITSAYRTAHLKIIYSNLVKYQYINEDTKESDFIYCMSGTGCKAITPIIWKKDATTLIRVLSLLLREGKKEWTKIENIFSGDTIHNLKQTNYNAKNAVNEQTQSDAMTQIRMQIFENLQ